jgi:hypothetical protein
MFYCICERSIILPGVLVGIIVDLGIVACGMAVFPVVVFGMAGCVTIGLPAV